MSFEELKNERLAAEQKQLAAKKAAEYQRAQQTENELSACRDKHAKIVATLQAYGIKQLVALMNDFKDAVSPKISVACYGSYLLVSKSKTEQYLNGYKPIFNLNGQGLIEAVIHNKNVYQLIDKIFACAGSKYILGHMLKEGQPWEVMFTSVHISLARSMKNSGMGESYQSWHEGIEIVVDESGITVNGHPVQNFEQLEAVIVALEKSGKYTRVV